MKATLAILLVAAVVVGAVLYARHAGWLNRGAAPATPKKGNPMVVMETSKGTMKIELWPDKAPITVQNFLRYTDEAFYDGTIFHRVIKGFMIQGGGFTPDMNQKSVHDPIKNEASAELKNDHGTLAMARTSVVDSATAQFFINLVDNDFLNHANKTPQGFGYCVFGKVVEGLDVLDAIAAVATGTQAGHEAVPVEPVTILSVRRADAEKE